MLNDYSARSKVIRAALELAEAKGWRDVTLAEIGRQANVSFGELREMFDCRSAILAAFHEEVDKAVLVRIGQGGEGETAKDRLLDVLMTRFEVLTPFKAALRRIFKDVSQRPGEAAALMPSGLLSQYWMLSGAGIGIWGAMGGLKVAGLAAIYGQVFPFWLEDTSPAAEKTMAMLDRKLTRGEAMLQSLDGACGKVKRLACCFAPFKGRRRKEGGAPEVKPEAGAAGPEMGGQPSL